MARIEDYYDPWNPDFVRHPLSRYRPLLSRPPLLVEGSKLPPSLSQGALPGKPVVLIARYDDVLAVMRDAARFSNHRPPRPDSKGGEDKGLKFYAAQNLLFSDPPVHTRLRRLVTRAFSPRRIRDLAPAIKSVAVKMIDAAVAKGGFEVMQDLAWPLPMAVIAEMLGVTREFYDDFHRWSILIIQADSLSAGGSYSKETREAVVRLREYVSREIEKRSNSQADDLISVLVRAQETGEALTGPEVLAFVLLLLLAGSETTTSLIGNTFQLMVEHPEPFQMLRLQHQLRSVSSTCDHRFTGGIAKKVAMAKFLVTLEQDEEGWWVAECPALPGCASQGRSRVDALRNIGEAIEASLETRAAQGLGAPSLEVVEVDISETTT